MSDVDEIRAETGGDRKLIEITERLAKYLSSRAAIDWRDIARTEQEARLAEARAVLEHLGVAKLVREMELFVPCEPCRRTDHEQCTGFCTQICCALALTEKELEAATAGANELPERLEDAPCVVDQHADLHRKGVRGGKPPASAVGR